jgi:hypothetical protein
MKNSWAKIVGYRGCIYPCSGKPVLKFSPGDVPVDADDMPVYLKCSECGYTPLSIEQPELICKYLKWWIKNKGKS